MYCQNCGSELKDNSKFCSKCRNPIITHTQSLNETNHVSGGFNSNISGRQLSDARRCMNQPEKEKKYGITTGKSIVFWIIWTMFALICLVMALYNFSIIQAGIFVILLGTLLLLRRTLFRRVLTSLGVWLGAFLVFFLVVGLFGGDTQRDREIDQIKSAFEAKDINKIAEYLHPEGSNQMTAIFKKRENELDKVSKLMDTKKLIYANDNYAEYEVKDGNKKYVMIFEKVAGKWCLSRF